MLNLPPHRARFRRRGVLGLLLAVVVSSLATAASPAIDDATARLGVVVLANLSTFDVVGAVLTGSRVRNLRFDRR